MELCGQAQGSLFAYLQSDEISLVLQDFKEDATEAWFDGNIQKIVSVAASIATKEFNCRFQHPQWQLAAFDARVFTIPDKTEVENYFIWRQKDATRNSIQSLGRQFMSHKEMLGLSCNDIQEKLMRGFGVNWSEYSTYYKRGRIATKDNILHVIPEFTKDRDFLRNLLNV